MINQCHKDVVVKNRSLVFHRGEGFIQPQPSHGMCLGVYLKADKPSAAVEGGNGGGPGTHHGVADKTAYGGEVMNIVFGLHRALFPGVQHLFQLGFLGLDAVQDKVGLDGPRPFDEPEDGLPFDVDTTFLDSPVNVEGHGDGPPVVEVSAHGRQDLGQKIVPGIGQAAASGLENLGGEKGQIFIQADVFLGVGRIGEDQIHAVLGKVAVGGPKITMMKNQGRVVIDFDLFETFHHVSLLDLHLPFFNRFRQGGISAGQQRVYDLVLNLMILDLSQFEQGPGLGSKGRVAEFLLDRGGKIFGNPLLLDDGIQANRHLVGQFLEGWKFSIGVGSSTGASVIAQLGQDLIPSDQMFPDLDVVQFVSFQVFVQFNETGTNGIQLHYLAVDCFLFEEFGSLQTMITGQKVVLGGDGDGINQSYLLDGLGQFHDLVRIKASETIPDFNLSHRQRNHTHGTMILRASFPVQGNIKTVLILTRECERIVDINDGITS